MSQTQTPARRRWTVRVGTTGSGKTLFEVYATTMAEARESVRRTVEESGHWELRDLVSQGFTVHGVRGRIPLAPFGARTLKKNEFVGQIPAPDFRELDADDIIPSAATHTFI